MVKTIFEEVSAESDSLLKVTRTEDGETSVRYKYRETRTLFEDWGFNGNLGALLVAFISLLLTAIVIIAAVI